MELKDLIKRWLAEEFPNWVVSSSIDTANNDSWSYIIFKPLGRYQFRIFPDRIELDDDKRGSEVIVHAGNPRFFELLWNRLHSMESGFQKAMASRDFNRPESR